MYGEEKMDILMIIGFVLCLAGSLYIGYEIVISKNLKYPPFLPSCGAVKKALLAEASKYLEAGVRSLKAVDLGCGTGSLLFPLAAKYPHHRFEGYEWDRVVCSIAQRRAAKYENVKIFRQDFTTASLNDVDVVLCFLSAELSDDLSAKFKNELPKHAVVISSAFELKGLKCSKSYESSFCRVPLKIYVYEMSDMT